MKLTFLIFALLMGMLCVAPTPQALDNRKAVSPITVRTESYPRPPYSGATYYIYEQSERTICTKLEVCNKFGDCSAEYFKGTYRAEIDKETGEPYDTTPPVAIPRAKLSKHTCLRRFKLI